MYDMVARRSLLESHKGAFSRMFEYVAGLALSAMHSMLTLESVLPQNFHHPLVVILTCSLLAP